MAKERILITVKTYPTLSRKYGETVCTAGLRQDGTWVRIYPVPFRRFQELEQYKKYDWVECELERRTQDPRPESYRLLPTTTLHTVDHIDTSANWRARRQMVLRTAKLFTNMGKLIEGAKTNSMSLAVFKPTKILDLVIEEDDREWPADKVIQMREGTKQLDLFEPNEWRKTFNLIPKLPYRFSYKFEDDAGKVSKLVVLDWEIGALFRSCGGHTPDNECLALNKIRQRYVDEFFKTDLHFYLGTTQQFHSMAPNPWVIIGVLPIPHTQQDELF